MIIDNTTKRRATAQNATSTAAYDMVVFSHLRWDFVYQRPQHIITRMARKRKVLFVEEPIIPDSASKHARMTMVRDNIAVFQPYVSSVEDIADILSQHIDFHKPPMAWFYSATFLPVLDKLKFGKVIYDCMDELSLFKGADPSLAEQEEYLMNAADIVFTGGKSLFESKSSMHKNIHCFPSSVERAHFEKALNGIAVPEDIQAITGPIAGYCGVIDERIDLSLIDSVAAANPGISFVLVGPLAKICDDDLPKRKNLHYLGMRSYYTLPNYLKGMDIAIMPFARNESTRFISPVKTLEYMAAGKPIISTRIHDIERDYAHCVHIVDDADAFSVALQGLAKRENVQGMRNHYNSILDSTSWESTVRHMEAIIAES